jgi:Endoplasmic reticulum vesicle transporter
VRALLGVSASEDLIKYPFTDHDHGSHGMPGIYIKYDMSALKVQVLLGRENVIKMSIRLCSVIAGIIVISSFINSILQKFWEGFLKTFAPQLYAMNQEKLPLMHDPQKTANIYDVLMKTGKESHNSNKPASNINLLTNNLMLSSDPIISLTTK